MTKVLKILKNGTTNFSSFKTLDELYKTCGFRKNENFNLIKTFENNNYFFEIWGRISGKDDTKNIYQFFDDKKINVFGNCVILMKANNEYIDFNLDEWECTRKIENNNIQIEEKVLHNNDMNYKDDEDEEDDDDDDDNYNFNDEELKKDTYIYTSEEEEEK